MKGILLLIAFSASAFAAQPPFKVMLKTKYDKNWYAVTQEGKKWICATKHVPYYEAAGNPLAELDWKALEKEAASRPKKCSELVGLESGNKRVVTCLNQKSTMELYKKISELCRARI